MHANAETITRFYEAFQRRDHEAMTACYAADVHFSDPVFTDLHGPRAGGMWRMLCERGKDLEVVFSDVSADDTSGRAHWDATYTFSATGRKVTNHIDATFAFRDGQIVDHRDAFDLAAWMRQAFGPLGVLGRIGFLQNAFRRSAAKQLAAFCDKRGIGA